MRLGAVTAVAAAVLGACGSGSAPATGSSGSAATAPQVSATPIPTAQAATAQAASASHAGSAAALATTKAGVEGGPIHPHHEEAVVECPAKIADSADDETRANALLDTANAQIDAGNFKAAWTCADRAADLLPQSVEAQHTRAAALAALGRDGEAQLAYGLALALDPDDPETLRAVADFYINGKLEHSRDALLLGLEYAERGSRRAAAGRRKAAPLVADLALLEAQALNDLGRSDAALIRVDAALKVAPGRADALHEKGVALFDLSRFEEAKAVLTKATALQPDDAYTHQMLGLSLEGLGDQAAGDAEMARATKLAPTELPAPIEISEADFRAEIDATIEALPPDRRARVKATKIEVADLPALADLQAVSPPFPPTILGLYRGPVGRAATAPTLGSADDEPVSIVLYRKNLERAVKTRAELSEQIRDTLLHEIGHLEGLDEDDLRRRGME